MPIYMHQWNYKDQQIRQMLDKVEGPDRANVVRSAIEAFGGKMHGFYFCFGTYDGVAISEFDDEATALACVMLIFGQGRVQSVHTTTLFTPEASARSIQLTQKVLSRSAQPAGNQP